MTAQHDSAFEFGNRRKTYFAYGSGFVLSLLLTMAAFALVKMQWLPRESAYAVLSLLAILQLIVQAACFLRLNATPVGRWNLLPFLFTLLIIAFLASGSMWIMYHLNANMDQVTVINSLDLTKQR